MNIMLNMRKLAVTSLLVAILSGCATQLAPIYDQQLKTGLDSVNTDVMTIFASVSDGTTKETYTKREDKYNSVIGRVDALATQSAARPMPSNNAIEATKRIFDSRKDQQNDVKAIPSTTALKGISETITKMRDTDKKQGITAYEVATFKSMTVIYLDQALTYEAALQR